jgi:tetraacyldisaccharide 4'-kinase
MLRIKQKVESVMSGDDAAAVFSFASWLHLISIFYGALQKVRETCYRQKIIPSQRLPCKVISIGNITVGGTGKTPLTIHVAQTLKQAGQKVAVVSRGYKGGAERQGGIVSDGRTLCMDAALSGDEPCLIAGRLKDVPVIVGKNRFAAGMLAVSNFQADVIVLDDAFQHLKLKRDLDLVLLDCMRPFGNTHLLPRGTLREPISSLERGTACILTRCQTKAAEAEIPAIGLIKKLVPQCPVFRSKHIPYCYFIKKEHQIPIANISDFLSSGDMAEIRNHKVFAFSGIARNDDFRHTLSVLGLNTTGFLEFSDHHHYTQNDLATILHLAGNSSADLLITTEKDYVRIAHKKTFPMDLVVVGVKVSFGYDEQAFFDFIKDRLGIRS